MDHPSVPHHNPMANVHTFLEARSFSSSITRFIVNCCCCNEKQLNTLDFSNWKSIKEIEIGSHSFQYVIGVEIVGLSQLERVVIGMHCFTKENGDWGYDPNRHFYLKNCERLRELKIDGDDSFSDYSVCEIENVPSLEVIEMGVLNTKSHNFWYASLELKSECERMK